MVDLSHNKLSAPLSVKAAALAHLNPDDLRAVLGSEKEYNRQLPCGEEASAYYACAEQSELKVLAAALKLRLQVETDILDPFSRLGLDPFAADLLAHGAPFPVEVVGALDNAALLGGHPRASFRQGVIVHAGAPPGLGRRLGDLASRGFVGNDLFHEVIHGLQNGAGFFSSLAEVVCLLEGDDDESAQGRTALAEAHAWLRTLPGFRPKVLMRSIAAAYGLTYPGQLQQAFSLLWGLIVLGEDDRQIGALVACASWSKEAQTYPALEERTRALCAAQGTTLDALSELRDRRLLIDRIQAVRAMGVARELVEGAALDASVGRGGLHLVKGGVTALD